MSQQPFERGQRLTLSLTAWGRLGEALASHEGQDIFVFGGIPGETVVAEVLRVRRKYVAARVVEVLKASDQRVEPRCPYYGDCTGCQWQHLDYPGQLAAKFDKVSDALIRVGSFSDPPVLPVLASPAQLGYRNHARFTVGRSGDLGFVNRETRQFIHVDHCMLMHSGINDLLSQLQDKCGETTQLAIRAGVEDRRLPGPADPERFSGGPSPPARSTTGTRLEAGNSGWASPSFFQVNIAQADQLAQAVSQTLDLQGDELLVDAYAGVGTFAALLSPHVGRVIAVEESSAAVADARENCQGLDNVQFVLGKTEEVLVGLAEKPDVVVVDPPRAGCQPQALESLIRLGPRQIAYVSCDPETLGRDLKVLCDGHYRLEQVQPVDMFPQTHHVECVASLRYVGNQSQVCAGFGLSPTPRIAGGIGANFPSYAIRRGRNSRAR